MKKVLIPAVALAVSMFSISPCYAGDGVQAILGFFGSVTSGLFDIPEGIVVESLYRQPLKAQRILADKFGDDKGFQQNVAAFVLGVPAGFAFGIPYGAIHGGRHGVTTGYEKPFSTESFIVPDADK